MPRLTSLLMSPCVATTRPSLTATLTPQPTPQKRHGAFDHLSFVSSASVTRFCASETNGMPATAAVVVAAVCLINSRRDIFIGHLFVHGFRALGVLVDEIGAENAFDCLYGRELLHYLSGAIAFQRDDQFAAARRVTLSAGNGGDGHVCVRHSPRRDLHDDAGDVELRALDLGDDRVVNHSVDQRTTGTSRLRSRSRRQASPPA